MTCILTLPFPPVDVIGIALTDSKAFAAVARGTPSQGEVQKVVEGDIPTGAMEKGMIRNVDQVAQVLKSVCTACGSSRVMLCLPPELLYCVTLNPSQESGTSASARVQAALASAIPEEPGNLQCMRKRLSSHRGTSLGVIAVRKDTVQAYRAACAKAGVTLTGMTTLPLILGARASGVVATSGEPFTPSTTFFQHGWPIDEALVGDADTEGEAVLDEVISLIADHAGIPVQEIRVAGLAGLLKGKKFPTTPESPTVTPCFPWVTGKHLPFLAPIVASAWGTHGINLLKPHGRNALWIALATLLVALAVGAGVLATLRPGFFPTVFSSILSQGSGESSEGTN